MSPLHLAARSRHSEAAQLLIEARADLEQLTGSGKMATQLAEESRADAHLIKLLRGLEPQELSVAMLGACEAESGDVNQENRGADGDEITTQMCDAESCSEMTDEFERISPRPSAVAVAGLCQPDTEQALAEIIDEVKAVRGQGRESGQFVVQEIGVLFNELSVPSKETSVVRGESGRRLESGAETDLVSVPEVALPHGKMDIKLPTSLETNVALQMTTHVASEVATVVLLEAATEVGTLGIGDARIADVVSMYVEAGSEMLTENFPEAADSTIDVSELVSYPAEDFSIESVPDEHSPVAQRGVPDLADLNIV